MNKNKSIYRVFDWDKDGESYFDTLPKARAFYKKQVKAAPDVRWRLYRDTEAPYMSGNFREECLAANESEGR